MRRPALAAVCVIVLAGGALTSAPLAAGDPFVDATITNVTVAPNQPQTDEPVTVTARIQNLQRSNSSLEIDAVELRASPDGDGTEYARAEDLGTLAPGTNLNVPLTNTFSSSGTYDLRVYVIGEDEDGDSVRLQYPVTVTVVDTPSPVQASISNVTVAPNQPRTDDPTTVTAQVQNAQTSNESLEINAVELGSSPDSGDDTEYASAEDLGTLSPGASLNVPLTNTFSSADTYRLRVYVIGEDEDGNRVTLQYPVTIEVADAPPAAEASITNVTVAPNQPQVGETTTLTARLQNLETSNETIDFNAVELRSSPSDGNQTTYTRAEDLGTLSAGRSVGVPLTYAFESPGVYQLRVYAEGETDSGDEVEVQYPVTLEVVDSTPLVGINTEPATAGNDTQVTVTVANGIGNEMRNVEVALDSDDGTLDTSRRVASRIPSGTQQTYAFTLSNVSSGNHSLAATVTYTTDDGATRSIQQQATLQVKSSQPVGRIVLTEVEVQPRGGQVRITGSASNVGLTEASGVVLSVNETDRVQPVDPYANFFVGSVPASEFASFELSASIDPSNSNANSSGNSTEIPVQVSYLVDGERRTQMTTVEYRGRSPAAAQSAAASESNQGPPLTTLAIAIAVALVVFGVMAFAWRNRGSS